MPFGNAVSGPAFGVLNELLGIVRGTDGIARQTRYETYSYHQVVQEEQETHQQMRWQLRWQISQEVILQERYHSNVTK